VNTEVGNKSAVGSRTAGSVLRGAGRVALWALICLLLVRGVIATAASRQAEAPAHPRESGIGQAEQAFAIRFARAYLADPSAPALSSYLAEGVRLGRGTGAGAGQVVGQAEVASVKKLGGGRAILTVACELRDSRTVYLAVPTARASSSSAGGVAAGGAPWIVAAPGSAGAEADRPRPLAGAEAGQIAALARRFARAYVKSVSPGELAYLLAPGSEVAPLDGAFRFVSTASVGQLGSGEGASRLVVVGVRVEDPRSGAIYPLAYRLRLIRGERWYVTGVQGAIS
jgi:hypothetical protein